MLLFFRLLSLVPALPVVAHLAVAGGGRVYIQPLFDGSARGAGPVIGTKPALLQPGGKDRQVFAKRPGKAIVGCVNGDPDLAGALYQPEFDPPLRAVGDFQANVAGRYRRFGRFVGNTLTRSGGRG